MAKKGKKGKKGCGCKSFIVASLAILMVACTPVEKKEAVEVDSSKVDTVVVDTVKVDTAAVDTAK